MADGRSALRAGALALLLCGTAASPAGALLRASVHEKQLTPHIGVPLAGYGGDRRLPFPDVLDLHEYAYYLKPSLGVYDPIHARVLLLEQGGDRLLFIGLDLVAVTGSLRAAILAGIAAHGFAPDAVLVSATHTHSGPGTLVANEFIEFVASDRYQPAVRAQFVARVVDAVDEAVAMLEPATLESVSFNATGLQQNRRGWGAVDEVARLLLVRASSGAYLGGVVNLSIHGTALGDDNFLYSGDVPGAIATSFGAALGTENLSVTGDGSPVPVLFLNGTEGDVAPTSVGPAGMQAVADDFTQQALAALGAAYVIPNPTWKLRARDVELGTPLMYLGPFGIGGPGTPRFGLDLRPWITDRTRIVAVALGDLRLLAWPGEPTTALGADVRGLCAASCLAPKDVWVLGLTNGYLGYFTTPQQFDEGSYESKNSLYGPNGGRKLVKEHCQLLAELGC